MRKRILCALLLVFSVESSQAGTDIAPDWKLHTPQQETVTLSAEVRQQPVVLFFWASWCPYCKALMPHLQSIRLEYGDEVRILAINFRDDSDAAVFMRRTGYDFTLLLDGNQVAERYEIWATPGILVIDQQQRIRFDLRSVPGAVIPAFVDAGKHSSKAAYIAPYWAAEIRKALDEVLTERPGHE